MSNLSNIESSDDDDEPRRKRTKNPEKYPRNIVKKSRIEGLAHVNSKGNVVPSRRTGDECR